MLILYYLLERTLPNDSLVTICPEWTAEKFLAKTGIALGKTDSGLYGAVG